MNTALISLLLVAAAANVVLLVSLLVADLEQPDLCERGPRGPARSREELRSSNKEANDDGRRRHQIVHGHRKNARLRVKDLQEGTEAKLEATRGVLERIRNTVDGKLDTVRGDLTVGLKTHSEALVRFTRSHRHGTSRAAGCHDEAGQGNAEGNQIVLERIRSTFDTRVEELRQSLGRSGERDAGRQERKLEEMRQTVDEKLQGTLEKRLGESFKFVSDRLEMVHKGLVRCRGLASGSG